MDNKLLDYQVNNICEGYGCFKMAATEIRVRVGQLGSISLDVCASCIRKFDENDSISGNVDLQQKIARNEEDAGGN